MFKVSCVQSKRVFVVDVLGGKQSINSQILNLNVTLYLKRTFGGASSGKHVFRLTVEIQAYPQLIFGQSTVVCTRYALICAVVSDITWIIRKSS